MTDHHPTFLPFCGAVHHDDPPSDASAWCAHWAAHGARVLSGDEVRRSGTPARLQEPGYTLVSDTGWKITGYEKSSHLLTKVHDIPPECWPAVRALGRYTINFPGARRLEPRNAAIAGFNLGILFIAGFNLGISLDTHKYDWFLEQFADT